MILDFFLSYPLKKNASFKGSFQGKTCYIFGNGSSLKNMCFSHFRDHPTIGINHIVLHKDFNLLNTCCYAFPEPFSFYYYYKNPYKKQYEINIDKSRFEQEVFYYLEKIDINEELIRLDSHLKYFNDILENKEIEKGKKLGFISQEIGREINTIGSKANNSEIQSFVVEMKSKLEKLKEQLLNIV